MEKEIAVLLNEQIEIEEIISFITKTKRYPRKFVEEKIQQLLDNWQQGGFTYKLFAEKEKEEREYFLKMARVKTIEELADVFAEMAIMLERALILTGFYSEKIKKLKSQGK